MQKERRKETIHHSRFFSSRICLLVQDGRTAGQIMCFDQSSLFKEKTVRILFYLTLTNLNSISLIATACLAFSS